MMERSRGLVVRIQSGFYWVDLPQGQILCRLRGRLKKGPRLGDLVAIGDWVKVTLLSDGSGVIEEVEPRVRSLSRKAPTPHGEYEQIIIANPDQAVLVFACAQPEPRLGMLDRYLIICEKQAIPPLILVNKVDLTGLEQARQTFELYGTLHYPLLYVSAKTGLGLDDLRQHLRGKVSVFTGPSGVGKSTILKALLPHWEREVAEVRRRVHKGRHTTVVREMHPLPEGGYVADTPGLKALALWDIQGEELDGYFVEMRPLVQQCVFNNCTHLHEPGCAIRRAVEKGKIHPSRYQSYLRLRFGEEEE
ncbi:MAG: ribosome small subunit-dependent GTPase A [Anaerolineales bacterium]|nr:ribosome small subunit-dependent GTPase A [Anaerolineales bacterium]MDW8448339.1 ribosome small subunit-dependent GTPase A [Anaerolineales bacterium]